MFESLLGLGIRRQSTAFESVESFVSPTALVAEESRSGGPVLINSVALGSSSSSPESTRAMRRLRSAFGRGKHNSVPLPSIRPEVIIHTASVRFIQPRLLGKPLCRRIYITTTKHTLSLHHHPEEPVPFDIIVREKISHVERIPVQLNCMKVQTHSGRLLYFAFDLESELYDWITDLTPINIPTNFRHVTHVEHDKESSKLNGLPLDWAYELSLCPAFLPEITPDHIELQRDFNERLSSIGEIGPDDLNFNDDDIDAAQILSAKRVETDTVAARVPLRISPLRIVTTDLSLNRSYSPPSASPSTPALTLPDGFPTPSTPSPLTPFRESPYSYRDSDAEDLTGQIERVGNWAHAHGGCADIWQAVWHNDSAQTIRVAVKVLRVMNQDAEVREKVLRRLRREVRVWHQLRHKHVVPMFGICEGFGEFPSMVSAWYENGHVMAYLQNLGKAATVQRRLKLLIDAARGLNYLHTFSFPLPERLDGANIVHGDLKGANILVNASGEAALADFGLCTVIAVAGQPSTITSNGGGSVRWMAPELLIPSEGAMNKTRASDVYSFGSVILEILTGDKPYQYLANDMQVITAVQQSIKPQRPTEPPVEPIWDLMERCWDDNPADRPEMSFVLSRLEKYNRREGALLFATN